MSWSVLIDVVTAEKVSDVVFDAPKIAVLVGTLAGVQFAAVFQSLVAGAISQVAS